MVRSGRTAGRREVGGAPDDRQGHTDRPLGVILEAGPRRATLTLLGPAFVASVAYVDPGNFAGNFAAGARYGYGLIWVLVATNVMAMFVQYSSAKIGLATGESLPTLCRARYSERTNTVLWLQGELVAMATDVAEFVGAAIGLRLLFGMSLQVAAAVTGVVAVTLLSLQRRGFKRFELAIALLLLVVFGAFTFQVFVMRGHSATAAFAGLLPSVGGVDQATLVVAMVGATVMPHVIYLHSSLTGGRITTTGEGQRRTLLRYTRADILIALSVAGIVNLSMLCIAAALYIHDRPVADLSLDDIHGRMAATVSTGCALAFAVALAVSGLASASVGTYAGQVVMNGFKGWRIPLTVRRLVTMAPSYLILIMADDPGQALVYSQVVLSFGIPFALVPLTLISADREVMGSMTNRRATMLTMGAISVLIISLNAFLVVSVVWPFG
jgi:manganese transport protein